MTNAAPSYGAVGHIAWSTVRGLIEGCKEHEKVAPTRIDRSLTQMTKMSGTQQGLLMSALHALGWIDAEDRVQPALRELIEKCGTAAYAEALAKCVTSFFGPVTADLDLRAVTMTDLAERFHEQTDLAGSTLIGVVRFYVGMLRDARIPHSPALKVRWRPKSGDPEQRRLFDAQDQDEPHAGLISFTINLPGKKMGRLLLPEDLEARDIPFVQLALEQAKLYAERRSSAE